MNFEDVQKIFYDHIHRRYHRFCRELFAQLLCLNYNIKPAYLFDLFPFSLQEMRQLLDSLSSYLTFPSILLKYSLNDLMIVNMLQLGKLMDVSVLLIDLTTMTSTDSHPMLDKIRHHLSWIIDRQNQIKSDLDNESHVEWAILIEPLNHTTVFGYLLGYPIVYFYSSTTLLDVTTLKNIRLYVQINDMKDKTLVYSFSCPIHATIDQKHIDLLIDQWYSSLSARMKSIDSITHFHLEQLIREQSNWCL